MREILFRGKRLDNGEWTTGYYVEAKHRWHKYGVHKEWIVCSAVANGGWFALHEKHAVKCETVGQYTGLTDKNGKKVFEGDICQTKNHHLIDDTPFVIEWKDGVYNGWVWHDLDGSDDMDSFENGVAKVCEVIGNIHDGIERK